MRKNLRKLIPYIIISIILIMSLIKVYADYMYQSSEVEYDNSNSELEATDVQSAIDELYEKAEACSSSNIECPDGYEKETINEFRYLCKNLNEPICKRATTLHTEKCYNTTYSGRNCYASYSSGATITYGQLGTSGNEPFPGDAFDCDVNNDGTFDPTTERFYYVSTYFDTQTQTFDNDYYVFIYYSNTYQGVASTNNVSWNWSSYNTSNGPIAAKSALPTTSGWRDDLLKTTTRNILMGSSVTSVTSITKSGFSYSGYAARLLTMQELRNACSTASTNSGSLDSCKYFFERTKYADSSYSDVLLESAYSSSSVWRVASHERNLSYDSSSENSGVGARPVIEIPKTQISY